jgi:hypothetical protein
MADVTFSYREKTFGANAFFGGWHNPSDHTNAGGDCPESTELSHVRCLSNSEN